MKILVIMTGGTIGSMLTGDWIAPNERCTYALLEHYNKKHPDSDVEFETVVPFTTLSEQLSNDHINRLIACVREHKDNGYGGIIITHGTDTLQYTASALGYVFGVNSLPIVLVSSNYPLEDRRANGHHNFRAAVAFIRSQSGKGTFVSYKNLDTVTRIHRASRLLSHPETGDEVLSLGRSPYAVCEDDVIIKNTAYRRGGSQLTTFEDVAFTEDAGVLTILMRPGEVYPYNLDGVKAVLIRPYHSGTLHTDSASFRSFCRRAEEKNIPLIVVDVIKGKNYESAKAYDELGLTVLPLSAFVPMYMKLWLAVSLGVDVREFALMPLAEEFVVEDF